MPEDLNRVLVIVAHPDDAEFGAGGTIARWAREGREVFLAVTTNGDKGSSDPKMTSERLMRLRQEEQREAARVLGIREVVFLGYPDGFLEDTPALRRDIVRLIRLYRPDIVVTHNPHPGLRRFIQHRDHRVTGTVALDAVYPLARNRLMFPELLAEGLEPHRVSEVYLTGSDDPDTWVDISETIHLKIAALRYHRTQVGDPEDLDRRVREAARQVGEPQGIPFAEAFRRIQLRR
jgi:LmbE family N-acetylglucosaminyl deacetylase